MIEHFLFVLVELQLLKDQLIALDQLACRKANRQSGSLCMVFDQMDDRVQAAVNRTAVILLTAEILPKGCLLIFRNVLRMIHQLDDALIFGGRDGDHRSSEHGFHTVHIHGSSVAGDLIHHVEGDHHRHAHFEKLHGQV